MTEVILGALFGAVQGIAEFFPISSSGHLVLFEKCAAHFGYSIGENSVAFTIALHGASLAAIVLVLRDDLKRVVFEEPRVALLMLLATVPIGVVGVLFEVALKKAFGSLTAVGGALIVTGVLLIVIERKQPGERTVSRTGALDAILIGIGQAFALMPGLSRSGCTISVALFRGLSREQAVRYSFLMAIPAIGGVCGYEALKLLGGAEAWEGVSATLFLSGTVSSFAFSTLALMGLLKLVRRHKLSWFSLWCLPLGVVILITRLL